MVGFCSHVSCIVVFAYKSPSCSSFLFVHGSFLHPFKNTYFSLFLQSTSMWPCCLSFPLSCFPFTARLQRWVCHILFLFRSSLTFLTFPEFLNSFLSVHCSPSLYSRNKLELKGILELCQYKCRISLLPYHHYYWNTDLQSVIQAFVKVWEKSKIQKVGF